MPKKKLGPPAKPNPKGHTPAEWLSILEFDPALIARAKSLNLSDVEALNYCAACNGLEKALQKMRDKPNQSERKKTLTRTISFVVKGCVDRLGDCIRSGDVSAAFWQGVVAGNVLHFGASMASLRTLKELAEVGKVHAKDKRRNKCVALYKQFRKETLAHRAFTHNVACQKVLREVLEVLPSKGKKPSLDRKTLNTYLKDSAQADPELAALLPERLR